MAAPGFGKEMFSVLKAELPAQLPAYLKSQRWFGGKARELRATTVADVVGLRDGVNALIVMVNVEYAGGGADLYAVPLLVSESGAGEPGSAALKFSGGDGKSVLIDALKDEKFLSFMLDAIQRGLVFAGESGEVRTSPTKALRLQETGAAGSLHPRALKAEQSNTSIAYGERLMLKFIRRLEEGVNPDLEMSSFLTEKAGYQNTPQLLGSLEYHNGQRFMVQGVLQAFVANQGDAWSYTMKSISDFYNRVASQAPNAEQSGRAQQSIGAFLDSVALLARRTAELHLALASVEASNDPEFSPEPFNDDFQQAFEDSLDELTQRIFRQLKQALPNLPENVRGKAEDTLAKKDDILEWFSATLQKPIRAVRTRIHGDYHLGQVLYTGADFVIIDFEGEPARPMSQRRLKRSPLQDVAGMLRSFHYAAHAPLLAATGTVNITDENRKNLNAWAEIWAKWVSDRYLEEYLRVANGAPFLPPSRAEIMELLQLHVVEKAVYELGYELNNRPNWVAIPLEGIAKSLEALKS
jgi:trehalose synthase-fused probable maltokinase